MVQRLFTLLVAVAVASAAAAAGVQGPASALKPVNAIQTLPSESPRLTVASTSKPRPVVPDAVIKGTLTVVGGALAHLTLGTIYCWGNFLSYAPAYLKFFDGLPHPGKVPDAVLVLPYAIVSQTLGMPFGAVLNKRLGPQKTLLLGCWTLALSVYLASYAKSLKVFMLAYSLLFGFGIGISYTAPMVAGWKWFPDNKGLVTGAVLSGFGAGGFFFNKIGTALVNPNKAQAVAGVFTPEVYASFPVMLRYLSAIYAVLSLVGTALIFEAPKPKAIITEVATGFRKFNHVYKKQKEQVTELKDVGATVKQAISSPQFWLLWVTILGSATSGLNTAGVYKQFGSTLAHLNNDDYMSLVGGLGALCNGLGRIFWGSTFDVHGFRKTFLWLAILQGSAMALYTTAAADRKSFVLVNMAIFFCLGGNFALFPAATVRLFGQASGTNIYAVIFTAFACASVLGGYLTQYLTAAGGWATVFKVLLSMGCASIVTSRVVKPLSYVSGSAV